jgi:cell division protein DivIC
MIRKALKRRTIQMLQSKYGLTALVALVWVTFAADIDLVHITRTAYAVKGLKKEVHRVERETERVRNDLVDLMEHRDALERFARERYFMKRPNEDVYRIVPAQSH